MSPSVDAATAPNLPTVREWAAVGLRTVGDELQRDHRFRQWFVVAYERAGRRVDNVALEASIAIRTTALSRWLDAPEQAPIGIRTATPAWRDRLRQFVEGST